MKLVQNSWLSASLLLSMLAACAHPPLTPSPEALAAFTIELRDRQPEDAFAAVYKVDGEHLIWLAAEHANRTDSATFQIIGEAYATFDIDTVIVEGFPASRGPNAARLLQYAREGAAEEVDGFQPRGETVPAVLGALSEGATIIGGEPDDAVVKSHVLSQGFGEDDLLGFYTMRSIPQWIRERKIADAGDPAIESLLKLGLARNRSDLALSEAVLPTVAAWRRWYQSVNGKPLGADFTTEEAGPLADGRFGTNAIGAAISRARASYLHELVISHLNEGKSVLVVFGASHLMIHRPALDAAIGAPCYVGAALNQAAERCG